MNIKYLITFTILLPIVLCLSRKELVDFAVKQYTKTAQSLKTGIEYPTETSPESDKWTTVTEAHAGWFQMGMYPGILWYLWHYTGNDTFKQLAIKGTEGLAKSQNVTSTHDIGFIIDNLYGVAYDLTKNKNYEQVIVNAAHHLATRYNEKVGCIRSWNSNDKEKDQFKVIVDNMMNIELLFRGHQLSGNQTLYDMAVRHANRTIENHLRKDFSSYHLVIFNETTGAVLHKKTSQGYSDSSCWSQGHAWLVHGFMTTYLYTKLAHFLTAAQNVANYFVDNLPEDGIAPWDFNVPKDKYPYIPRDSSAASIASTGLFQLYQHTKIDKYLNAANKIMTSLASPKYRADGKPEYKIPALIVNGTWGPVQGEKHNGRADIAMCFGDFYFVKAFQFIK